MSERWYVLRSKPRREEALSRYARMSGHEVFYPTIPVKPVNPRASRIRPYFPGYLFVRTDLEAVGESTFRWMPFSHGMVTFGGEAADVQDHAVRAIRVRVDEIWEAGGLKLEGLVEGDRVVITDGMFEGYEGIFDTQISGNERARILLRMMSRRFVPVEVDVGLIRKVKG